MGAVRTNTILLVEDEAIIALSEKRTLEKNGYAVLVEHTGEAAVEAVRTAATLDIVLMDIDLGSGIDGTEAARRILAVRDLPIVFLTSHAEGEFVERVEEITRYGYVLKSSGELVLLQSVRMALELFDAHRAVREKQSRLSHLINEAPIGIYQVWSTGEFLHMNTEMARLLGFDSPEEAVSHYSDIGTELYADPNRRREVLDILATSGTVRDFRFRAYRADGRETVIKSNVQVIGHDPRKGMLISGFSVDENEQEAARALLIDERRQLERIIEGTNAGTWRWNIQTGETVFNDRWAAMAGYCLRELAPTTIETWRELVHPDDIDRAADAMARHFRGETEYYKCEVRLRHRDGGYFWVIEKGKVAEWTDAGEPVLMYGTQQDITRRKRAEEQLLAYKLALDSSTDLVAAVDPEYRYIFANRVFLERHGVQEEQITGTHVADILGREVFEAAVRDNLEAALRGETISFDMPIEYPDAGERQVHVSYFPLKNRGEIEGVVSNIRDVTELKENERQLRSLNAEKDFLMRELNHRVKNNLAMINALISVKESSVVGSVDLTDLKNQVNAVRIVHDRLQQHTENIAVISLGDYVDDLLESVFTLSQQQPVVLDNRIEDVFIPTRHAVTVGLILSELATNAMKHGFRDGEEARFVVSMREEPEPATYLLTVSNTGRPFPEDVDPERPETVGLRLVAALVSQLDGTIDLRRTPCTEFNMRLRLADRE